MEKEIVIFGDSNIKLFNYDIKNTPRKEVEIERDEENFESQIFNGKKINFIWRIAFTVPRVNKTYMYERLNRHGIDPLNKKYIFLFGTTDIRFKSLSFQDIDKMIFEYLEKIIEFSKNTESEFYIVTPILHTDFGKDYIMNYFIKSLYYHCELFKIKDPIDLSNIVGTNFIPPIDDAHKHLNVEDSKKVIEFIVNSID